LGSSKGKRNRRRDQYDEAMPTYATAAQLRTYTGLDSTALPDATANALLLKAEDDIDALSVVNHSIDPTTERRFIPASLSTNEAMILRKATCAQAEYRNEMGSSFFIRAQHASVSGPDFSTTGRLSYIGPAVYRHLAGSGLIRLSTTTTGQPRFQPKTEDDFAERPEREEFELG